MGIRWARLETGTGDDYSTFRHDGIILGFQLVAMLMAGFDKLPESSKYIHLISLLLVTLSTIVLMAPAAYHRIVEDGENTVRFWRYAQIMLHVGMAALAAGVAAEFLVVCRKVTEDMTLSMMVSASILVLFYALWFGFTIYKRFSIPAGLRTRQPL